MLSSTTTLCSSRKVAAGLGIGLIAVSLMAPLSAQDTTLRAPAQAIVGQATSLATTGGGAATFYLSGPASSVKRQVQLGSDIQLQGNEVQRSGRYVAVVCAMACTSATFFVAPAKPASLTFLAHPSRVPVGQVDAISGVALASDSFQNLALTPATVNIQLVAKGAAPENRSLQTKDGIAWFRTNSAKSAGPLQLTASLNGAAVRRVVQSVASEPCNLRIKGQRTAKGVSIETEPIRDCAGNAVPDGTVVTFTARNGGQISTVDAPIKQDVARAQFATTGSIVVSAASGVVLGNELRIGDSR
jgi:hypothetical protein